jgi:thiamine biosynthesis lipoprotein
MKQSGILITVILMTMLCGCAPRGQTAETALFAMDTYCRLEVHGKNAEEALTAAAAELERLEALFSITKPDSDVSRINASDGEALAVSADTLAIVETADAVSRATNGAFDITIEPIVRLWGVYGGEWRVPEEREISEALRSVDYTRLRYDAAQMTVQTGPGQRIDLGGIGKGYASDRMAQVLMEQGVDGALITLGGNVHALGPRRDGGGWRIGIRDPLDESGILAVVELRDQAIITAGSYQRYFDAGGKRYHHIMDPATGRPAENGLLSVTVIAESGAYADALATALCVMGAERAIALWRQLGGFDMILVSAEGHVQYTTGVRIRERSDYYQYAEIVE